MDYEALKGYPQREIDILADVMDNINKRRTAAVDKAKGGGQGSMGSFSPNENIGIP